jgi:hypothetical protein
MASLDRKEPSPLPARGARQIAEFAALAAARRALEVSVREAEERLDDAARSLRAAKVAAVQYEARASIAMAMADGTNEVYAAAFARMGAERAHLVHCHCQLAGWDMQHGARYRELVAALSTEMGRPASSRQEGRSFGPAQN